MKYSLLNHCPCSASLRVLRRRLCEIVRAVVIVLTVQTRMQKSNNSIFTRHWPGRSFLLFPCDPHAPITGLVAALHYAALRCV